MHDGGRLTIPGCMFVQLYWPRWPHKLSVVIDRAFVHFGVNNWGEWNIKLSDYIDANMRGGKKRGKKKGGGEGRKKIIRGIFFKKKSFDLDSIL